MQTAKQTAQRIVDASDRDNPLELFLELIQDLHADGDKERARQIELIMQRVDDELAEAFNIAFSISVE